jgi:hypothetical protein
MSGWWWMGGGWGLDGWQVADGWSDEINKTRQTKSLRNEKVSLKTGQQAVIRDVQTNKLKTVD